MQPVKAASGSDVQPTDIIFECPQCGKSLAIDLQGSGLVVACPDCATQIQVPGLEPVDALTEADTGGDEEEVDLAARVRALEKQHAADQERLEAIARELDLIQAALDRMVDALGASDGA